VKIHPEQKRQLEALAAVASQHPDPDHPYRYTRRVQVSEIVRRCLAAGIVVLEAKYPKKRQGPAAAGAGAIRPSSSKRGRC
jgi:hypothetical protein